MNQVLLSNIVNDSGFPFQIRVADEVRRHSDRHRWAVEAEEYWWQHNDKSGFVDLLLAKEHARPLPIYLVVECKRYTDGPWVFLPPSPPFRSGFDRNRVFVAGGRYEPAWWEVAVLQSASRVDEQGRVAAYCAMPKSRHQSLEQIAGELILATEGVAMKYHDRVPEGNKGKQQPALFFPVIVTTAPLYYCDVEVEKISLEEGKLDAESAKFPPLEFVRFRKTFRTARAGEDPETSLWEASLQERRTVWIVQASHLTTFLRGWQVYIEGHFPRDLR